MIRDALSLRGATAVLLVGLTGLAGACSKGASADDDEAKRQDYVDAFVAASDNEDMTDAENACLSEAVVDAVGVDKLADNVSTEEIRDRNTSNLVDLGVEVGEDEGDRYYEALAECIDLRSLLISTVMGGQEVTDEARACLDEQLTDDLLRALMVNGFTKSHDELQNDSVTADQVSAAFQHCAEGAGTP